jgi:ABC-type Fe3+-hydroxamate transport system substrate-binding protein
MAGWVLAVLPPAAAAAPAPVSGSASVTPAATPSITPTATPTAREVTDDRGRRVRLPAGRLRIVSLAPHATELLAAAGALGQLIAVDPHSDQPPAVRGLRRIAAYPAPDVEALAALAPDLVVLWGAGARREVIDRLESLGIRVFVSEPRRLADVAASLERLAAVSESPATARGAARAFESAIAGLRERYRASAPVPVFIQLSARPLMTLTDRDPIGDILQTCGARNLFGEAPGVAVSVGTEAVLARRPALILAFDADASAEPWRGLGVIEPAGPVTWRAIDPALQRPGPRLAALIAPVCEAIDAVRRRGAGPGAIGSPR